MTPCAACFTEAPTGRADGYCPECFGQMQSAMNGELRRRGRAAVLSASALELARLEHIGAQTRPPSLVDELRAARSPHSVDWILGHFELEGGRRRASRRALERLERVAYVRKCELAGVLP